MYEAGQQENCENLQTEIKSNFTKRIDAFGKIEETVNKLLQDQYIAIDTFDKSSKEAGTEEMEFLACQEEAYSDFVRAQKTEVENFEMKKLDPVLLKVATDLKFQIEELDTLKSTVSRDLENLTKTVNSFSVFTVETMKELKSSVDQYATASEQKMRTIDEKNKEILESETKIKGLLDQLLESYMAHSQLVTDNTNKMQEETSADLDELAVLMAKSNETVTSAALARDDALADIDKESVRIVEYCTASTGKILHHNLQVEKHVEENIEALDRFEQNMKTSYESRAKLQAAKLEELKQSLERNKFIFSVVGHEVVDTIQVLQTTDIENTAVLCEKIGEVSKSTTNMTLELGGDVLQTKGTVRSFLVSELRKCEPTGLTPGRVVRSYPRELAATSPHQSILSRFRVQAELAAASKFSLDDTDDSGLSQSSGALSRQSSSTEIRKISPNPVGNQRHRSTDTRRTPSVSRTPSSSRAGSRASSRSRQHTNVDLKKSVSTSDIGSEIGDQENEDPNFRKPRALKRELKKPEVRNRRLL